MRHKYFTKDDYQSLEAATTYHDLWLVAEKVLERSPNNLAQVCGPISSGGAGSVEKNLEEFDNAIEYLHQNGVELFDQMPFEQPIQRLKDLPQNKKANLLEIFYQPVFESGRVSDLYFLPGWQQSNGATWEHEQGQRLELNIIYMPDNWKTTTQFIK